MNEGFAISDFRLPNDQIQAQRRNMDKDELKPRTKQFALSRIYAVGNGLALTLTLSPRRGN